MKTTIGHALSAPRGFADILAEERRATTEIIRKGNIKAQ